MTSTWPPSTHTDAMTTPGMTASPTGTAPMRPHMGMGQSLRAFFANYARFNGRAGRSEFWWAQLGVFLITLAFSIATSIAEPAAGHHSGMATLLAALSSLWGFVIIVPNLALEVRRLHDVNRSGWWVLLHLVLIVGTVILLVMWCGGSRPEGARFDADTQPALGD